MYTDTSDAQLLDYWRARRDADAFAELVARYGPLVYSACLRVLRSAHAAEDAAQDCFIDLIHSSARVRSLPAFLHTTATRRAVDRLRAERRRAARESYFAAEQPQATDAVWDDVSRYVDEAIATLPAKQQRAVVLRFLQGRTYAAIAAETNLPPATVQHHLKRGIEGIRQHLRRHGITASAGAIAVMLAAAPSHALPASATAKLGSMALAGGTTAAGGFGAFVLGSATTLKLALAVAVLFITGLSAVSFVTPNSQSATAPTDAIELPAPDSEVKGAVLLAREIDIADPPVQAEIIQTVSERIITGSVIRPDGTPLPEAQVQATWADGTTTTQSGVDGAFTIAFPAERSSTKPSETTEITLAVSKGHFQFFPAIFEVPAEGLDGIVVSPQLVSGVSGRVIDSEGKPLADWLVSAASGDYLEEIATDADGQFQFMRLPSGECVLTAADAAGKRHTSYNVGPLDLKAGEVFGPATLVWPERWRSLAGQVTGSNGEPLEGVAVRSWFAPDQAGLADRQVLQDTTNRDGRFELTGFPELPDFKAQVQLAHRDYMQDQRYGIVLDGHEEHFVLPKKPTITGRAVDARTGEPLTQFRVSHAIGLSTASGFSDFDLLVSTSWATLDDHPDGTFTIQAHGFNTVRLAVAAPGYETALKTLEAVEPGATVAGVEIRLRPAAPLKGLVLDEANAPIAGARIYHGHPLSLPNSQFESAVSEGVTQTNGLGEFILNEYPPGLTLISAYHENFAVGSTEVKRNGPLRITLTRAGDMVVEGFITLNGAPVSEGRAHVGIGPEDAATTTLGKTNNNGHYRTDTAPSGSVWISAHCDLGDLRRSLGRRADLAPGSTLRADFDFDDGDATIEGVLLLEDEPVPLAVLQASATQANGDVLRYITESHGDGTFSLGPILAGDYEFGPIWILLRDGSYLVPDPETVTVAPGETVVRDLLFTSQ